MQYGHCYSKYKACGSAPSQPEAHAYIMWWLTQSLLLTHLLSFTFSLYSYLYIWFHSIFRFFLSYLWLSVIILFSSLTIWIPLSYLSWVKKSENLMCFVMDLLSSCDHWTVVGFCHCDVAPKTKWATETTVSSFRFECHIYETNALKSCDHLLTAKSLKEHHDSSVSVSLGHNGTCL